MGMVHCTRLPVQATADGSLYSAATRHRICKRLLAQLPVQDYRGGSRCQSAAALRRSMLWLCLITFNGAAADFLVLCLCRAAEEAASARQVLHLGRFFSPMDVTITATTWKQRQLHIQFQSHRSRCAYRLMHTTQRGVHLLWRHMGSTDEDCQLLRSQQGPSLLVASRSVATRQSVRD